MGRKESDQHKITALDVGKALIAPVVVGTGLFVALSHAPGPSKALMDANTKVGVGATYWPGQQIDDSQLPNRPIATQQPGQKPYQTVTVPTPTPDNKPTTPSFPPAKPTPTPNPKPTETPNPDQKSQYKTNTPEYNDNSNNALTKERLNDSWGWYFNQRDAEWDRDPLGYSNKPYGMGNAGCLVADIAMMWSHLTGEIHTPAEVNRHKEWFVDGSIAIKTPLPTLGGHEPTEYDGTNFNFLHQQAQKGYSFILELKWTTPQGQNVFHYVVARGLDSQGHFLINDSWYGGNIGVPYGMHWSDSNFTGRAWAYK